MPIGWFWKFLASTALIIFEQPKRQNTLSAIQFPTVFWYIDRKKLIFFWFLCGVYTKTIFHLSVGASSVYYPQFSEWLIYIYIYVFLDTTSPLMTYRGNSMLLIITSRCRYLALLFLDLLRTLEKSVRNMLQIWQANVWINTRKSTLS